MGEKYWKIDKKLVERISKVSRIELTDKEIDKFSKELESILDAFREMDKVDTSNVEPSFHPQELKNDWREDKVDPYEWDPLDNTEHKEDGYFKGPRIV